MTALTLALLLSLPASQVTPQKPLREPSLQTTRRATGGRWYFAASGHAVYCYGPVLTVPDSEGNLQKVATFCRDGTAVVPLMDEPGTKPEHNEGKAKEAPAKPRFPRM